MKLLAVCGATATGKSELAVACAKLLNGEIVSADSLLVYRGLNVGTAKPTLAERGGVPHHLIDVVEPTESFSVSDYERLALQAVEEIAARGKTPILCGGTGFYLKSVLFHSSFGKTPADPAIRKKYEEFLVREGKEALFAYLREIDPESAEKLHVNDTKRVIRAIEIYEATGRKKSEQNDGETPRFPYLAVGFDFPREELYARIDRRAERMLERGLVDEVKGLLRAGVPETAQCMQGIGYKEVLENLKNGFDESTLRGIIQKNTRNYAKRQLTFFKKMNIRWIAPKPTAEAAREVKEIYDGGRID